MYCIFPAVPVCIHREKNVFHKLELFHNNILIDYDWSFVLFSMRCMLLVNYYDYFFLPIW